MFLGSGLPQSGNALMMRKRTITLILAVCLLLSAGFIARGPLISAGFQWYFKGYCQKCLGGKLTYDSIHHENGSWVFERPLLITKNDLAEGGYRFQAERATIDTTVLWLAHTIDFKIGLEAPQIDVGKGAEDLKKILNNDGEKFRLFNVHSHFNVPKGSILVHNFSGGSTAAYNFSLDLSCKDAHEGCASLWLGDENDANPDLHIAFSKPNSKLSLVRLDFISFDGANLAQAMQAICPCWIDGTLSKGTVDGSVTVFLPARAPPYAEGELVGRGLSVAYPAIDCLMDIPEATLTFAPGQINRNTGSNGAFQTQGRLDISGGASLAFIKHDHPYWTIETVKGSLDFKQAENAIFSIDALCKHEGRSRHLHVNGEALFAVPGQDRLAVSMHLQGLEKADDLAVKFSARELGDMQHFVEMEAFGLGPHDFAFLQYLVMHFYPEWKQVNISGGAVDLAMLVYLKKLNVAGVEIKHMAAHDIKFAVEAWDLYGEMAQAAAVLSFDLSDKEPMHTLNADLNIVQGKIASADPANDKLQLADINTTLKMRQGVLQKSVIQGNVGGFKSLVELDGASPGPLAVFEFNGQMSDIAHSMPESLWQGIDSGFSEHDVKIVATANKSSEGFLFKGNVLLNGNGKSNDEMSFGFELARASDNIAEKSPPDSLAAQYCPDGCIDVVQELMPGAATPAISAYDQLVMDKLGGGVAIKNGWFAADNLRLDKYLAPFIFPMNQMQITGVGDFRGTFDRKRCVVHYDAREVVLENDDLAMELKSLGEGFLPQDRFRGVYVFNIEHGRDYAMFPVRNATYFEKNSGLLFTDVNAEVTLDKGGAHLSTFETYCNGVYFAGAIDVDWSMPDEGYFEVDIAAQTMHGKISQIQHIFSHFDKPLMLVKIPVEGNIGFHRDGGKLHFSFEPGDFTYQAHAEGVISDAKLTTQNADIFLQELSMNFEYDHQGNTLDFSDIQGALLVGRPNHMEEYAVASDWLRFTDYENNSTEFDIWVGDKKRDIIRLAGKTNTELDENGEAYIDFEFDHSLSHFGDVHPSIFQLALKDWDQIRDFRLEFSFHMKSLLYDLQRFSRTGLLFLSRNILKELNAIKKAEGEFKAAFAYDARRSVFNYHVMGTDVAAGMYKFNNFLLVGKKKGSTWTVDQLQLDDISLAIDIEKDDEIWNINFLGARFGKSLMLGLEGKYNADVSLLEARVNLLEANLAHLDEWMPFQQAFEDLRLAGKLHATGGLRVAFDRSFAGGVQVDLQAEGSLQQGKIKGLDLNDIKSMSFQYTSDKGITLSDISTSLKSARDGAVQADLFMHKACCDFTKRELTIDGLAFKIPATNLTWLSENLQQSFPSALSPPIADIIRLSKTQGEMSGELKLALSESNSALRLALNDDVYRFLGREHKLSGLVIDCDDASFKICTTYAYRDKLLGVGVRSTSPSFDAGELILSDLSDKTAKTPEAPPCPQLADRSL